MWGAACGGGGCPPPWLGAGPGFAASAVPVTLQSNKPAAARTAAAFHFVMLSGNLRIEVPPPHHPNARPSALFRYLRVSDCCDPPSVHRISLKAQSPLSRSSEHACRPTNCSLVLRELSYRASRAYGRPGVGRELNAHQKVRFYAEWRAAGQSRINMVRQQASNHARRALCCSGGFGFRPRQLWARLKGRSRPYRSGRTEGRSRSGGSGGC